MFNNVQLLGLDGKPIREYADPKGLRQVTSRDELIGLMRNKIRALQQNQSQIKARFDAAQTFPANQEHWSNADHFDPHTVASAQIRRTLRSRSRYEVIENNPFLKGTILSIANDFVGSGPKLQITDKRLNKTRQELIEKKFNAWMRARRIRQKLWRLRIAKITDGEGFMLAYQNRNRNDTFPVKLDFQVIEADRVSSEEYVYVKEQKLSEIDGVRFDRHENPVAYHILHEHPGHGWFMDRFTSPSGVLRTGDAAYGDWFDEQFVVHWFRQDRGWLRGIPETTPSLPLCAILRQYTLSVAQHARTAASITAIIETNGPPDGRFWTDANGNLLSDDPFDIFPLETGSIMNLPWGYTTKQLNAVPLGVQFDAFTGCLLREITRPLLCTYNLAAGTSKDSNMASGVLDQSIYKGGQESERLDAGEVVMDKVVRLWWLEFQLTEEAAGLRHPRWKIEVPEHTWGWDRIGLDHTDPQKVAAGLQIMHDKKFTTDRDIQERYFNRSYEDWQKQITEEDKFRMNLPSEKAAMEAEFGTGNEDTSPTEEPAGSEA